MRQPCRRVPTGRPANFKFDPCGWPLLVLAGQPGAVCVRHAAALLWIGTIISRELHDNPAAVHPALASPPCAVLEGAEPLCGCNGGRQAPGGGNRLCVPELHLQGAYQGCREAGGSTPRAQGRRRQCPRQAHRAAGDVNARALLRGDASWSVWTFKDARTPPEHLFETDETASQFLKFFGQLRQC